MPTPARSDLEASPRPVVPVDAAGYDLIVVGGVPGAGKTTAIARATDGLDHVVAIDPENVAWWLRHRLPARLPYRAYRSLVHLVHTLRVVVHLIGGPVAGRRVVIHDPGTRARRRRLFLGLAHLAGWRTVLLYVDVDRSAARDGQRRRGRVVPSFDDHWARWQHLRPALDEAAARGQDTPVTRASAGGDRVLIVDRGDAADVLRRLCR